MLFLGACGSSTPESNGSGAATGSGGANAQQQGQPPPSREAQEAFALYSRVRADYDRFVATHDPAWRRRLELAPGMQELNQLEPRYVAASDAFAGLSRQALASLDIAGSAGQAGQWERFRDAINQALAHIAPMRQMVEQIEGEVRAAEANAPDAGAAPPDTAPAP